MSFIMYVLGVLCYVFAAVDFLGMFFRYDLTGTTYSPVIAVFIGSGLIKIAEKLEEKKQNQ